MQKSKSTFILMISILLISCSNKIQMREDFFPEILDGVYNISFSDHTDERMFSGHWGSPKFGINKKFYRILGEGGGTIHFFAVKSEKYILDIRIGNDKTELFAKIKNKIIPVRNTYKYLSQDLINPGENIITFFTQKN